MPSKNSGFFCGVWRLLLNFRKGYGESGIVVYIVVNYAGLHFYSAVVAGELDGSGNLAVGKEGNLVLSHVDGQVGGGQVVIPVDGLCLAEIYHERAGGGEAHFRHVVLGQGCHIFIRNGQAFYLGPFGHLSQIQGREDLLSSYILSGIRFSGDAHNHLGPAPERGRHRRWKDSG